MLAAMLLGLLAAPAAMARPAWLPHVELNANDQKGRVAQVAVDPQGTVIAAWTEGSDTLARVMAAVRPAGGPWQAPVVLSAAGQHTTKVQIAVDPQANALVVWERSNAGKATIQSASRPAGGAWGPAVDIAVTTTDFEFARPQVALDAQGAAVVVYQNGTGTEHFIEAAARPAGGAWQAPVTLSAAGRDNVTPQLAVDPQGTAVAVWTRYEVAGPFAQAAVRPPGAGWQAPVTISAAGHDPFATDVAIDAQGNAVAVWDSLSAPIRTADRPAAGSWQAPVAIEAGTDPQIAVGAQGHAVLVWKTGTFVRSTVRPPGGAWEAPVDLPGDDGFLHGASSEPAVAIDSQGKAVAVWQRVVIGPALLDNETVQAAVRLPNGAAWQPATDLGPVGVRSRQAQVAIDGQGNAVAVWKVDRAPDDRIQASGYDAVAPQLRSLSIPASAVAGKPVAFSVSPFDVWSALLTAWTFGDGTRATGNAVSHTYAKAGTYSVGVTAFDEAANSTAATRTIAIAPAASTTPALTRLRVSPSAFRAARKGATVRAASVRSGTRVSYALSLAAKVRFTVRRATRGRKLGGRCVTATRANRRRASCTRYVTVQGSFTRSRRAGRDRFTFTGRLAGRTLRAARYRLTATPSAGTRKGKAVRASFRIKR